MEESTFVYGNFINQLVPQTCLRRLAYYRGHLTSWAEVTGQPLRWVMDSTRDLFIMGAPEVHHATANEEATPVFLLGQDRHLFTVEFAKYIARCRFAYDRYRCRYQYLDGILRMPARLRVKHDPFLAMTYEAVRAYCETRLMYEDAQNGRVIPSVVELFSIEVPETKYFGETEVEVRE